jgi:hypothetical protein
MERGAIVGLLDFGGTKIKSLPKNLTRILVLGYINILLSPLLLYEV